MIAVDARRTGQRRDIRAGLGLGQRERADRLAARDPRQVARLLRRRAVEADRARAQALHREREVGQARMARERFADQADCARVDHVAVAAMLDTADRMLQPARRAELPHQRPALRVDVMAVRLINVLRGPGLERLRKRAVPVLEERPCQILPVAHVNGPWRCAHSATHETSV